MQSGDRLVCAFVEPKETGKQFSTWLLHVTIVPWFRLQVSTETIVSGLERALYEAVPFNVEICETAMFGPRRNRPAGLVRQPTPFTKIENLTRNYLRKKRAWLVDETTKTKSPYRPHVTAQKDQQLKSGNSFKCDYLYVIEQKVEYKEIVGQMRLGLDNE